MRRCVIPLLSLLLLVGGCHRPQEPQSRLVVKLAVNDIYCTDTACSCVHDVAARRYAETQELLREQFGIDLELDYYIEPYDLEAAILSGRYDGAICKPWTALMLEQKAGADFERVVDVLDPQNNQWLKGIVVVMAESPIQSLEALSGKRVVMGQADVYEKHQAAKQLFSEKGIVFSELLETASCIENLGKLMDGLVDAAVVSDYALSADCAVDFADPDDFRVLGATARIPLTSVLVAAGKVSPADRARLRAAFMAITAAGAPESMLSKGFVVPAVWEPVELER